MAKVWIQAVLITLLTAVVLTAVHHFTQPKINQAEQQHRARQLGEVVPPELIDAPIQASPQTLAIEPLGVDAHLYWGTKDRQLSVVLMDLVTPNGYSGDIRLLVAVDLGGRVLGVRVLEHRETPGLGDGIEIAKSPWIEQFKGRTRTESDADWAADRLGGQFDTLSSATITSQAVIQAVQFAVDAYQASANPAWIESIQSKTPP